jgi:hypothetical protein
MLHRCRLPAWALWLILAFAAALPAVPPARAQEAGDLYTVRDVDVDVTADSALAARDKAIAEAQRKAFVTLYQRLSPDAKQQPPSLSNSEVAQLVQNFEVQRERSSAVRYNATLTVQFRASAVRNLMLNRGASFVDARSKPVLVLPVYQVGGQPPVLWEDRTPWRDAWENYPPPNGVVPVIVPFGELADVADVGVNEALNADASALAKIGSRYGAGEVLVARLSVPGSGPNPAEPIKINLIRQSVEGGSPRNDTVTVPAAQGQPTDAYLTGGVAAVVTYLENAWKSANTVEGGPEETMQVSVPIGSIDDWVQTRKRLSKVATITRMQVLGVNRDAAHLELRYRGDPTRLSNALSQQDLELTRIAVPAALARAASPATSPAPLFPGGQQGQMVTPAPVPGMGPAGMPTGLPEPGWQIRWTGSSATGSPAIDTP